MSERPARTAALGQQRRTAFCIRLFSIEGEKRNLPLTPNSMSERKENGRIQDPILLSKFRIELLVQRVVDVLYATNHAN